MKYYDMDEIVESVAKQLGGDLLKTASGPALEAYKADLVGVKDENDLINAWNKHMDDLNQEESTNDALKLQAEKAKELGIPGYSTPIMNDDKGDEKLDCPECHQEVEPMPAGTDKDERPIVALTAEEREAALKTAQYVVKLADAMDQRGCSRVSDILDETLKSLTNLK